MTDKEKQEVSNLYGDMVQALHDDLDQGVAWLTEKAIKDFYDRHPNFSVAMSRLADKIGGMVV